MIKAFIFDLDGTLIQTEVLKATSYAKALVQLSAGKVNEEEVLGFFDRLVGLSRQEVVLGLVDQFGDRMEASDPVLQARDLIGLRLEIYHQMLNDEDLLSKHFCPYSLGLLKEGRKRGLRMALATMSHRKEAQKVLSVMGIVDQFECILTKDDVEEGKPAPEIYLLVAQKLSLSSKQCLVLEDSVNGIKAAQAAGMPVFALTNTVTRRSVHEAQLLERRIYSG